VIQFPSRSNILTSIDGNFLKLSSKKGNTTPYRDKVWGVYVQGRKRNHHDEIYGEIEEFGQVAAYGTVCFVERIDDTKGSGT
jgi:hypothetical protein